MKYHRYYDLPSVCCDCAHEAGFVPKKKIVGMWIAECSVCGKRKPTCDLVHDYCEKEER